jgi:hypothetical protein
LPKHGLRSWLQLALWDAAMTGDISAAVVILKIVKARVHLNGLEPARDRPRVAPQIQQNRAPALFMELLSAR